MKNSSIALAALALVACAGPRMVWVRPDTSRADYDRDVAQCEYEAASSTANYGSSAPIPYSTGAAIGQGIGIGIGKGMEQNKLIELCLRARGYTRVAEGNAPMQPMAAYIAQATQPAPWPTRSSPPAIQEAIPVGIKGTAKYQVEAERFARNRGCVVTSSAMTSQAFGTETFAIACSDGRPIMAVNCEAGFVEASQCWLPR